MISETAREVSLLFVRWKTSDDSSVRKESLTSLEESAPDALTIFKSCVKGSIGKTQKSVSKKLQALADAGFPYTVPVALFLCQSTVDNLGLRFLCQGDFPECKEALAAMIDDAGKLKLEDLTRLPSCLPELPITNLFVSRLDEPTFPMVITQLNGLTELCLHVTKFPAIPSEITQLAHLEVLRIYYTELSEVPAWVFELPLKRFEISTAKKLVKVAEEISRTSSSLEILKLCWAKLSSLPSSISSLRELRELEISGNKKLAVPASVFEFSKLEKLKLGSNQAMNDVDERLGQLVNLQELDLSFSSTTKLPDSIGNLKQLTHFSLLSSNDELTEMPESFYELKKIKRIFVGDTRCVTP